MIKSLYKFLSPKYQNLVLEYAVQFKPRYGHGKPPHKDLYDIVNENRAEYQELLKASLKFKDHITKIKKTEDETNKMNPVWNNGFLPGLDIVNLYSILALKKPKKYVEVGSGNSTKVAYKAKMDHSLAMEIISIDPFPRAEIDDLSNKIIRKPFEDIDYDSILDLNNGDILFIDNSHRILPNSDAMVFFLEILPKLKAGVIVHIHDIYLPYDYPQFMCDRFYTEQYGLAIFLLANKNKYRTIMPNYFVSQDQELNKILNPIWQNENLKGVETHGGSFWLEINE